MEKLLPLQWMTLQITNHRSGEIKFGENDNIQKDRCYLLQNSEAKYVIVGIQKT
jgi:hypothetical protein